MLPNCTFEAEVTESVRFPSGPWILEGELAYPESHPSGAVLLAGPHPMLGGTMHNNVILALGGGLASRGLVTLRFNYRGIGNSDGPPTDVGNDLAAFWRTSRTSAEAGYQDDFVAALRYLRSVVGPDLPVALLGYSFGCTLLPTVVRTDDVSPLLLVAPTVGSHDYAPYATLRNPKWIIAPQEDFAAHGAALESWAGSLPEPVRLIRPRLDGHFFRGSEEWLVKTVAAMLETNGRHA